MRLQSITETYNAISSDGVSLIATMNIRFRLQRAAAPVLHQAMGPNYLQLLVRPGIGSLTREVISQYNAEQVYSTARQEIQDKIRSLSQDRLSEKMMEREGDEPYRVSLSDTVILYDTLVYGIELPALVVNAINRKIEQYYISEEYKFRVEREKRESERKKIEAEGIREFQQVVSQGISDSYLRWRGIEATPAAFAIHELEGRDHRQREGRPAAHPQAIWIRRRHMGAAGSAPEGGARNPGTRQLPLAQPRRRMEDPQPTRRTRPAGISLQRQHRPSTRTSRERCGP